MFLLAIILITLGALFSLLNWSTLFLSRSEHFVSSVPLAGSVPLAIGMCLFPETRPWWWVAVLADYGTLMFLLGLPWIIRESRSTSRFNLIHEFSNVQVGRSLKVRLFRNSIAVIEAKFDPPRAKGDDRFTVAFSWTGDWEQVGNRFRIFQYASGRQLYLCPSNDGFESHESNNEDSDVSDNLDGLLFAKSSLGKPA